MKKYSKSELKAKNAVKLLLPVFLILLIASIVIIIFIVLNKEVIIENIDDSAKFVSDDVASKSTPIVCDDLVIGAIYDKTWVSLDKYFLKSQFKKGIEIDVYDKTAKAGEYKLNDVKKSETDGLVVRTSTTRYNRTDEYFAVAKNGYNIMSIPAQNIIVTNDDVNLAKKAIGIYMGLNSTIQVSRAYSARINSLGVGKLLCVNAVESGSSMYSAVVYISPDNDAILVKYSYINDKSKAQNWPVYDVKFVADFNGDSVNDVLLQEVTEFNLKYDVLEFRNNKFYEVLSTTVKI